MLVLQSKLFPFRDECCCHTCTEMFTYIPWMQKLVRMNMECGTSHKTQTMQISINQSVINLNIPTNFTHVKCKVQKLGNV